MAMTPPPPPGYQSFGGQTFAGPHPKGTTILVLGILSFFCFGIIIGTIAFIMGNSAIKEIDANPSAYTNRGVVNAGRICGAIGAVLSVLGIIYFASR
jgi:hypothetical protein